MKTINDLLNFYQKDDKKEFKIEEGIRYGIMSTGDTVDILYYGKFIIGKPLYIPRHIEGVVNINVRGESNGINYKPFSLENYHIDHSKPLKITLIPDVKYENY